SAHWPIMKYLIDTNSMFKEKYDMVASGPLGHFLKDHELNKEARYFKFASFASEEVEALGDRSKLGELIAGGMFGSIPDGAFGIPGIKNALTCVKNFYEESDRLEINPRPKLIVMGHSSGCRSSVKFLEVLNKAGSEIKADLVITLDPVKEAHSVAVETAAKM